ncbi:MAG: hypothetical protein V3S51_01885 [Dehalococcoidia bacterium]
MKRFPVFLLILLVLLGCAQAVPYPPDTEHQELLSRLEEDVREYRRGLWQY